MHTSVSSGLLNSLGNVISAVALTLRSCAALRRELTKDSAFIGEVRWQEKQREANARDKKQKRAIAFLEQQESDFKSGGQGGMNPHKKRKRKE
jgi:hypothetical protein